MQEHVFAMKIELVIVLFIYLLPQANNKFNILMQRQNNICKNSPLTGHSNSQKPFCFDALNFYCPLNSFFCSIILPFKFQQFSKQNFFFLRSHKIMLVSLKMKSYILLLSFLKFFSYIHTQKIFQLVLSFLVLMYVCKMHFHFHCCFK